MNETNKQTWMKQKTQTWMKQKQTTVNETKNANMNETNKQKQTWINQKKKLKISEYYPYEEFVKWVVATESFSISFEMSRPSEAKVKQTWMNGKINK